MTIAITMSVSMTTNHIKYAFMLEGAGAGGGATGGVGVVGGIYIESIAQTDGARDGLGHE